MSMNLLLSVFFGFIGLHLFCIVFWAILSSILKRRERARKMAKESIKWREQSIAKKKEWNQKVNSAKKRLKGASWEDPAGKEEFVKELFGDKIPRYLWYEVNRKLTQEDSKKISEFFWDGDMSFGDLEMHRTLRVRNARRFTAMLLDEFPLVQIGYMEFWDSVDEHGFPTGSVIFSVEGFYPKK